MSAIQYGPNTVAGAVMGIAYWMLSAHRDMSEALRSVMNPVSGAVNAKTYEEVCNDLQSNLIGFTSIPGYCPKAYTILKEIIFLSAAALSSATILTACLDSDLNFPYAMLALTLRTIATEIGMKKTYKLIKDRNQTNDGSQPNARQAMARRFRIALAILPAIYSLAQHTLISDALDTLFPTTYCGASAAVKVFIESAAILPLIGFNCYWFMGAVDILIDKPKNAIMLTMIILAALSGAPAIAFNTESNGQNNCVKTFQLPFSEEFLDFNSYIVGASMNFRALYGSTTSRPGLVSTLLMIFIACITDLLQLVFSCASKCCKPQAQAQATNDQSSYFSETMEIFRAVAKETKDSAIQCQEKAVSLVFLCRKDPNFEEKHDLDQRLVNPKGPNTSIEGEIMIPTQR